MLNVVLIKWYSPISRDNSGLLFLLIVLVKDKRFPCDIITNKSINTEPDIIWKVIKL